MTNGDISSSDASGAKRAQATPAQEMNVGRLTKGQRECLELVAEMLTSKMIAKRLDISRHTVDARLREAIATLGVSTRQEAARLYIDATPSLGSGLSQRLISQPMRLADHLPIPPLPATQTEFARACDERPSGLAERQAGYSAEPSRPGTLVSQSGVGGIGSRLRFGPLAIMLGILGVALFMVLATAALVSIAEVISRLI